ncbi:MAG: autotransporter outer membrane beta-barrel domain-containing protein [Planctomycetes bacterium]|nr:autotransporter outer membrane beta-barrel domain-containing protein [Planctomycetota bacterium]
MADAAGLGSGGGLTLDSAADSLVFQDLGDGAATGTLAKALAGAGSVVLTDDADITLAGNNAAFAGTFDIEAGSTLRASAAGQLGTADVLVDGTLVLASAGAWTLNNTVTGDGAFIKTGVGQLDIGNSLAGFAGTTEVAAGTLIVGTTPGSGAVLGGLGVTVDPDATLAGTGSVPAAVNNRGTIAALNSLDGYESAAASDFSVGPLTNQGTIRLAGGAVGNTLTVHGGMTGIGGSLIINTVLGGDDSPTDRLILDGGATDGTTSLIVHNAGGGGGQTDVGILVVDARNGATTTSGAFLLSTANDGFRDGYGTIVAGAYDYELLRGGNGGDDQSWYLVSERTARPEAGVYLANREAAESMFRHSLHDRLAGYETCLDPETGRVRRGAAWARAEAAKSHIRADGGSLRSRSRGFVMQTGIDLLDRPVGGSGAFTAGVMGGLGWARTRTAGGYGVASRGHFDGYQAGVYGTWFQDSEGVDGWYVDGWLHYSWYRNRVHGGGVASQRYHTHMWSGSLEAGYAFRVVDTAGAAWNLVPTFQAIYSDYDGGRFAETTGTSVRHADGDRLTTRLGLRLQGRLDGSGRFPSEPYAEVNWLHRTKTGSLGMDGDVVYADSPKNAAELKLGWEAEVRRNLRVGAGVFGQVGGRHYRQYGGQLGLRFQW